MEEKVSPRRISITDVARHAQVSITTVSRVINKIPTVNKENIKKVEEAIAYLKYRPNISAQRLAKGLNNAVGLVFPGYPGIFYSFYAIELIRGVGHSCEMLKLDLIFHITNGHNFLNTNNVGGIIFADIIENRKQVEAAVEDEIPCFVINHIVEDMNVNYVAIDNRGGGHLAVDYLISLGHKKIATVTGNLQTQSGMHRLEGYKKALTAGKIPIREDYIFPGDYSRRSARTNAEKILQLKDRPTAIFSASDDMAMEIMGAVMEKGLRIPQDISIIGFDDNPQGLYGPVGLTTVKQPLFQMGEDAVRYLSDIIPGKKKSPVRVVLPASLVIRESCSSPQL